MVEAREEEEEEESEEGEGGASDGREGGAARSAREGRRMGGVVSVRDRRERSSESAPKCNLTVISTSICRSIGSSTENLFPASRRFLKRPMSVKCLAMSVASTAPMIERRT